MTTHRLKTLPLYFEAVRRGLKTFEIRLNDRDFKEGDTLELAEWSNLLQQFTGPKMFVMVTYLMKGPQYGLAEGWVIMSFRLVL